MHFWKQLKLLLWKNITLRKRQPIRFFMEVFWPIILLGLLAAVRTRNPQRLIPECHFDEKALPSAGIIPMFQSYICGFNNTCKTNSTDDRPGKVNMFHDSLVTQVFSLIDIYNNAPLLDEAFLNSKFETLISEMERAENSTETEILARFICGSNAEVFGITQDNFGQEFDFAKANVRLDATTPENLTSYTRMRSAWKEGETEERVTSEYCQGIFNKFEEHEDIAVRYLWKPLKSFVLGKLFYTPDTPLTRRLVKRMNQTFESVDGMIWAGKEFVREIPRLKEILDQMINPPTVLPFTLPPFPIPSGRIKRQAVPPLPPIPLPPDIIGMLPTNRSTLISLRDNLDRLGEMAVNITNLMECMDLNKFVPVPSEEDLAREGTELVSSGKFWAGFVFESLFSAENETVTDIPSFVRYKIRYDVERVDATILVQDMFWTPGPRRQPLSDLKYWTYGFSQLQDMAERALMAEMLKLDNSDSLPGVYMQQFPHPCYIKDYFFTALSQYFPLIMTLAWVFTAAMMMKSIVYEKEKRLKETMLMMGLVNGANRLARFLETFVTMHVSIIFMVLILKYGNVLMHSNPFIVYIFLLAFCLSTIAFSFFLSVFFSKANVAAAAGGILFFTTFMPYFLLSVWEDQLTIAMKLASCLLPNIAFGWGSNVFARREEQGVGVQFSNAGQSVLEGDSFTLNYAIFIMLADSLALFLLTWYLDATMPGGYGIARPWYFPVTRSYWFGSNRAPSSEKGPIEPPEEMNDRLSFEPEPEDVPKGVQIRNLRKVYGNGKVALNGLSANFYEGITGLLGHNGAGKSTTFGILCGLFPATSGEARIYGYNVQTEMDRIRESFGFCPQHNVLWDDLTVEEHLFFYASLKLDSKKAIKLEVDKMIEDVGLPNKRHEMTKNLSGGMQRKLSVAIAYIGGAKVVLLDEPTAGVDPWARRGIWNLMIQFRKNRTTIMSTHFHGEADTLSDRVAIIADGQALCSGSPVYLKKRFGNGYHLTLVKSGPTTREEDIGNFIRMYIPEAQLVTNVALELAYVLPTASNRPGSFALLFEGLDANLGFLEITSYGIRDTSLEEVFLRVMEKHDETKPSEGHVASLLREGFLRKFHLQILSVPTANGPAVDLRQFPSSTSAVINDWDQIKKSVKRISGTHLKWQQMKALHIKRFHNLRRSKKSFACEILLPAAFVCLAMLVTLLTPAAREQPPLELTPWLYGPPNYIFFANHQPNDGNSTDMVKHLYEGPGLGTRCMAGSPVTNKTCLALEKNLDHLIPDYPVYRNASPECQCSGGGQSCPEGAGGPKPPCMMLNTTDWLCNMNDRNITDWIFKSAEEYDATRYGGFTFGEIDDFSMLNTTEGSGAIARYHNLNDDARGGFGGSWEHFLALLPGMYQRENVKVWFNNRGWASSVAYVNAINNVILRSRLASGSDPFEYGVMAINHPLKRTAEQMEAQIATETVKALLHSVCIIFAMSFVPASFVMFLIEERVSGAKNLQFTAKVPPWLYWVTTFTWDLVNYTLTTAICVGIFFAFNEQAYVSPVNAPMLVCLLLLYGFAAIPMMYIPSFFFQVPSSAFVALACSNLFLGLGSTISIFLMESLKDELLMDIAQVLKEAFLALPHYCLGRGLMELAVKHVQATIYAQFGKEIEEKPFDWSYAGRNVVCLAFQGVLFFGLTILIEYRFFIKSKRFEVTQIGPIIEDKDVAAERYRVQNGEAQGSVLRVSDLTMTFKKKKTVHVAVDKLTFGIGKGECFGLLGVNGAGKSTTFKMLTGNLIPTSGDAFVNEHSVVSQLSTARQYIGYCPQFDAINELLTGQEHLQFYARLHGIPERYVNQAAERGIQHLQLTNFANRSAGGYSGGNKRKLSTAIALIGDPDVVFLDEPTTGMDPKARRFLWNCILAMIREGRSVTLTSHSLEECETLCTKLSIMVNGRFQCFGSLQHLKTRFGFGYSVIIRCALESVDRVCDFMETTFKKAKLQEKHYNTVQYRIPLRSVKLHRIFSALEQNRELLQIEDSSVNQTNLEDIFIEFAKHQTDITTKELEEEENQEIPEVTNIRRQTLHEFPGYIDTRTFDALSRASSFASLASAEGLSPSNSVRLDDAPTLNLSGDTTNHLGLAVASRPIVVFSNDDSDSTKF